MLLNECHLPLFTSGNPTLTPSLHERYPSSLATSAFLSLEVSCTQFGVSARPDLRFVAQGNARDLKSSTFSINGPSGWHILDRELVH